MRIFINFGSVLRQQRALEYGPRGKGSIIGVKGGGGIKLVALIGDKSSERASERIRVLGGASRKELFSRFEAYGLTGFRVIPIQTKYPRALSSCIMHTHRQQKQPPPFTAGLDSPRPAEIGVCLPFTSRFFSGQVFRVILLCCDSIVATLPYLPPVIFRFPVIPNAFSFSRAGGHTERYDGCTHAAGSYLSRGIRGVGVHANTPST